MKPRYSWWKIQRAIERRGLPSKPVDDNTIQFSFMTGRLVVDITTESMAIRTTGALSLYILDGAMLWLKEFEDEVMF